jgi:hypothetical protein
MTKKKIEHDFVGAGIFSYCKNCGIDASVPINGLYHWIKEDLSSCQICEEKNFKDKKKSTSRKRKEMEFWNKNKTDDCLLLCYVKNAKLYQCLLSSQQENSILGCLQLFSPVDVYEKSFADLELIQANSQKGE